MADESIKDPYTDSYDGTDFVHNTNGSFNPSELSTGINAITPISSYADSPILAKDITINQSNNVWIRVFVPRQILESSPNITKLPLIIFFHGGGFMCQSAATTANEPFFTNATVGTPAVLVSVNYRLAPEHRLPAAYDDGMEVLHWIKNSEDEWLSKCANISNTYVMGASAGANIAYQVGLRAASTIEDLEPLTIKGLILHQPFFGGIKRTQSEIRYADDKYLPLWGADTAWDLALPYGADRDHEYCNPLRGFKSNQFDQIKALGWRILIAGQGGDPLIDRQTEFLKMLQEKGLEALGKFEDGGYHGIECDNPSKYMELCNLVKAFVTSCVVA